MMNWALLIFAQAVKGLCVAKRRTVADVVKKLTGKKKMNTKAK